LSLRWARSLLDIQGVFISYPQPYIMSPAGARFQTCACLSPVSKLTGQATAVPGKHRDLRVGTINLHAPAGSKHHLHIGDPGQRRDAVFARPDRSGKLGCFLTSVSILLPEFDDLLRCRSKEPGMGNAPAAPYRYSRNGPLNERTKLTSVYHDSLLFSSDVP
jgi:hypothetical protein